jgi:hypothetical protein
MATQGQFEHEDIATVPRGWKVRTLAHADGSQVRLAFPPGPRKKGSGRLVSILHPLDNPKLRALSPVERHQLAIAKATLKMPDAMLGVMGGMTKEQAQKIVEKHGVVISGNPKSKTREQVEAMKAKAVRFLKDVVGDSAKASEIEDMSVEDYAAKKKLTIENPRKKRNAEEVGTAKLVSRGGGLFSFGRSKDFWEYSVGGRTYQVKKGKGRVKIPVKGFYIDKATGKVFNPDETAQAGKLFREFHGEDAREILEVQDADIARDTYTVLGILHEMKFKLDGQAYTLSFKGCDVKLGSSAEGNQLYCLGGDQNCEKLLPQPDTGKDLVELGTVTHISYVTRKGFDKFRESIYEHKFGEEGGKPPSAWYARLAKRVLIGGGDYRVEAPGIID